MEEVAAQIRDFPNLYGNQQEKDGSYGNAGQPKNGRVAKT
jgi:hypothetical protein